MSDRHGRARRQHLPGVPRMLTTSILVAVVAVLTIVAAVTTVAVLTAPSPVAAHEDDDGGGPPVFLVHGMPDSVFEVQVGQDRRLKGLRFGQFYNLRAFAGTTLSFEFAILDTGRPVVATTGFAVPSDRSTTLVVHHGADGSGALTSFENDLEPLEGGTSRLVVRHLAEAPPFDVVVDGEVVASNVEHGWEESVELPSGDVSVSLVAAGAAEVDGAADVDGAAEVDGDRFGTVDLSLTPGDRTVVYGFGSSENATLAIVTDVVHGSDADSDGGPPLRAMTVSTALALVIGAVGLTRIRRRTRKIRLRRD